ncbi:MAG: hypothetical protein VX475_14775, partial [Myxococcota bacterium]|nr:hypothetical protein [Myxococcota bacterium]
RAGKQDGQQGQEGKQGKQGQQGKDGKQGQQGQQGQEGQQGQKPGEGEGQGKQTGEGGKKGNGESKGDKPSDDPTDTAGSGQGDRNLDEESSLKTNRVDVKVKGNEGKGESKSEIIKGASEEGFASRKYKDVYGDYSSVVEEVMEKENVPKGYRYYVKRYFQLIKPREQE